MKFHSFEKIRPKYKMWERKWMSLFRYSWQCWVHGWSLLVWVSQYILLRVEIDEIISNKSFSIRISSGNHQDQRVLLKNVKVLTLLNGQKTQARRVSSIPQLKCIGGSAKCFYVPDHVKCYNQGSDGIDIQVRIVTVFFQHRKTEIRLDNLFFCSYHR